MQKRKATRPSKSRGKPQLGDPFKAIADPRRRQILVAITEEERSVSDLTALLDISQPAVSQHLNVLREAGLVEERRDGRFNYYTVRPQPLKDIYDWLSIYEAFWKNKLDALAAHLQKKRH